MKHLHTAASIQILLLFYMDNDGSTNDPPQAICAPNIVVLM